MEDTIYCVISHTHWDREWYLSLERFRVKLVNFVDNLLEILEKNNNFVFHLDAQTIIIDDYLEIKPDQKKKLFSYIKEGRILLGPWYVQNDFYLTSGESTIRNLLIGCETAEKAGKSSRVGYAPDQFGLISQLPQLFKGFGIHDCIFGRGYNFFKKSGKNLQHVKKSSEFVWQGSDGSEIFAVHMPFWYNNAQRFSTNREKGMQLLTEIENNFKGIAETPYLLLMNGVDHLEAQEDLLPILKDLNKKLPAAKTIKQFTMSEYIHKVKSFISGDSYKSKLSRYIGEMRNGTDQMILQGTLSSRVYLKILNSKAQTLMENILEPLYSMIWIAGAQKEYPADFIAYLWKELLKNHPHDSICGCSCDEVHESMEDRYKRFFRTTSELTRKAMEFLSTHISRKNLNENKYLITVFNTTETLRSGIVQLDVMFPIEEGVTNFDIYDDNEDIIHFSIIEKKKIYLDMFTPINLPGTKEVDLFSIQISVHNIPKLGFSSFLVLPYQSIIITEEKAAAPERSFPLDLENDFIKVNISSDGNINLLHKKTGRQYTDILTLEDTEDCGDSYIYKNSPNSETYTTKGLKPEIINHFNNDLSSSCTIKYSLYIPEGYNEQTQKRSNKLKLNEIKIQLSLKKSQPWMDINFTIDNTSNNHRVRALINTGIITDYTSALSPFDIIVRDRKEVLNSIKSGTQPNSGFVCIENNQEGIALLNKGLYEYEHPINKDGIIAMTLLRANGIISSSALGEQWKVPGNQCIREISVSMAIHPYAGDLTSAEIVHRFKEFQTPLLPYYQPVDLKKFSDGRPAVQDSHIEETFYRKDKYPQIKLNRRQSFLEITSKEVVISAIKKANREEYIIVRLFNTSDQKKKFSLTFFKPISKLTKVKLDESEEKSIGFKKNKSDEMLIGAKEIITIAIR